MDRDDGAEGAVADVGTSVGFDVKIAVRGAGGDAVADGEGSTPAGSDLLVGRVRRSPGGGGGRVG